MKSTLLSVFFTVLLLTGVKAVSGQSSNLVEPQAKDSVGWHISLLSAGLGCGVYSPNLGFWNNESEIRNWDQKFKSAPIFFGNIEVSLRNNLRLRGEAGFAIMHARQTVIPVALGGGKQTKQLSLVPVSAIVLYDITKKFILIPYIGAGAGTIFIYSANEKTVGVQEQPTVISRATDYMFYGVGGAKYSVSPKLFLAAEVRGALGKYMENVTNTQLVPVLQSISLNGLQVQLSLNYSFGKK